MSLGLALLLICLPSLTQTHPFVALPPPPPRPYSRLAPALTDLSVTATLKLILKPLVPVVPGFGAAIVSLVNTPLIKFAVDFGPANTGAVVTRPVAAFLDPFIRDTLANMLVWPKRVVVPILPEDKTGAMIARFE